MTDTLTAEPPVEVEALASAKPIEEEFKPLVAEIERLKATAETLTVKDEDDKHAMKLARATRLTLREIRIGVEKRRKELKEDYLKKGQRIDAAAREITALIAPLEERMLEQEQFAERKQAEREARLQEERTKALLDLGAPASMIVQGLGKLTEPEWELLRRDAEAIKEAREAKAKAEEEARLEAARKAKEEEERRAQELAEAKAKAEEERKAREAAEAAAKAERERLEAEAKAAMEKARAEREAAEREAAEERAAIEAKAKAEREAAEAVAAAKLAEERAAREKAEAAAKAAREAEAARLAQEEALAKAEKAAAEKAAKAPDAEKIRRYTREIRQSFPNIKDDGLRAVVEDAIMPACDAIDAAIRKLNL